MTALLVTNDFPPRTGGIESYLYELWRRLPPDDATVLTNRYRGAPEWDAAQQFRIVRTKEPVLLPTRALAQRIDALAREISADVIFLDPWLPLGALGPRLRAAPYLVIVHGSEVTVPGRLPGSRQLGARGLHAAAGVVAAGTYPAREAVRAARRPLPGVIIPPGVDVDRFHPIADDERAAVRRRFGLDPDRPLVLGTSRLVPRKGFDVLIDAMAHVRPDAQLVIAGEGRDRARLERRADAHGPGRVRFLGRVPDDDLAPLTACCRPVRDAVPRAVGRPGGRGVRHRVPRGGGVRGARDRGPKRRLARSGRRRRDRSRGRAISHRGARRARAAARRPRRPCGDGRRRRGPVRWPSSRTTSSSTRLAPIAAGDLSTLQMLT